MIRYGELTFNLKNMSKRIFTPGQIAKLSRNKNVRRCGSKSVRFRKDFKATAVQQYNEEGLSAVGIFESAGFDLDVIGKRVPNRLMNQWNKAFRVSDGDELDPPTAEKVEPLESIGRRIRSSRKLRTLKAKVAYLQAENDFLAQLRARKRK